MRDIIPVYKPSLGNRERLALLEGFDSGWISSRGPSIDEFERQLEITLGGGNCTTVSNGTVALHLALLALGIGAGDEVILPDLTYVATLNAVRYVGATPVLVDVSELDWNIDPELVVENLTSKTKAVMCVHLYGAPCRLAELRALCDQYELFLIEDCAEAIGSRSNQQICGSVGDISTFSFFGNKTITTGEGGAVFSSTRSDLIDRCRHLKNQAQDPIKRYWHSEVGFNYRMTNLCASIGLAQITRLDELLCAKADIAEHYKLLLRDTGVSFQPCIDGNYHSYWMVSILLASHIDRDNFIEDLYRASIETRPVFYPLSDMFPKLRQSKLEVSTRLSSRGLNLPSFPDLTKCELEYICENVSKLIRKFDG